MAGIDQSKCVVICDLGHYGIEFSSKFDLGLDEIEFRDSRHGRLDGGKLFAKFLGKFKENSSDLAFLLAFEVLKLIIRLDRVERLDKNGRA